LVKVPEILDRVKSVALCPPKKKKKKTIKGYGSVASGTLTKNSSHLSTVILTTKRFVYVLPEVLHGDLLSEITYLFNIEGNILHILTRNVIFFYDYSN
jgi:hypothetical protein